MKKNHEILYNQEGFTLIEVLIAVVIFTIGILSVNAMQIASIKGNLKANRVSESTFWCSDRFENFLALDYDDLADTDGDGNAGLDDTGAAADNTLASPDGQYILSWNIARDDPFPNVKTIKVIIERQDFEGIRTVEMTYIRSDAS